MDRPYSGQRELANGPAQPAFRVVFELGRWLGSPYGALFDAGGRDTLDEEPLEANEEKHDGSDDQDGTGE